MRITPRWLAIWMCAVLLPQVGAAQVRLLGVTGNQEADDDVHPDETLFDINLATGALSNPLTFTNVPDTDAIGFNPNDGLLYRVSGSEAYTDNPARRDVGIGFRDNQYMETLNLDSKVLTPIFNSNPPPSPDDIASFGLVAPRPTWVRPEAVRLFEDVDPSFRERGDNEYHALRDLTWSKAENTFFGTDENGIFKLSPTGESTFVGTPDVNLPRDIKGISFADIGGETRLLIAGKEDGLLYTIAPDTAQVVGDPVELQLPAGSMPTTDENPFGGLLAMDQHPVSKVMYGIRKTDDPFARELITFDPVTGATALIGSVNMHLASIAFVGSATVPGDFNQNGSLDAVDIDLLSAEVLAGTNNTSFDVTGDAKVDETDRVTWVHDLKHTYFGDADLNGEFNSGDLVNLFQAGLYEDAIADNAGWATGDFNNDKDFDSGDFVTAFTDGGYEQGPRPATAAVPEPMGVLLFAGGLAALLSRRRRN